MGIILRAGNKDGNDKYLTGVYTAHARGFGFVTVEGEEKDIFIPTGLENGAFHGDRVVVSPAKNKAGERYKGRIVKILSRGYTKLVGYYKDCKKNGVVLPDDRRFLAHVSVKKTESMGAATGQKVVVLITSYGANGRNPEGKVIEILGNVNDPGTDILSIAKAYDLPLEFPEKALRQADRAYKDVSHADMEGRMDLRGWMMVTIDGEDAKDLDDAVSVEKRGGNYLLGVHIADVANYVQEKSALDKEALKRGTSVYLADRVIPMLPEKLSNGICSLNAGSDRLALSCLMTIDPKGNVTDHQIAETVIRVDARMTYTKVKEILEDEDRTEMEAYRDFVPMLRQMEELSRILRGRRLKRGSIDFNFPESKVILDAEGKPVKILPYEHNTATGIIEDFMLIANETVAEEYFWREIPFIYRTHEAPEMEKIRSFAAFIQNFGYSMHISNNEVRPGEISKILSRIEGSPNEALIGRLALRSMKRARYMAENKGHFGLSSACYCHFTSPIRRYPDLQIHRIIKDSIRGRLTEERKAHYGQILPEVADKCSLLERRAEEAERETVKLKKVEYMETRCGEVYTGIISSVTKWGIYVELPDTIEGLIHVSNLRDDYYEYIEDRYEMVGERTGKTYRLGQKLKVKVLSTDKIQKTIDFLPA